jgi:hypothetical protein
MATALQIVQHFHPEVTTVKDAKRNIHIEVLPRDTSLATVKNHKTCAMAVACKRRFHLDGVIISVGRAYLVKGKTATRFKLPESVSREIVSFDRKAGFAPGEYQLDAPSPSTRLGVRSEGGHTRHKGRGNGDKRFQHATQDTRTKLGTGKD